MKTTYVISGTLLIVLSFLFTSPTEKKREAPLQERETEAMDALQFFTRAAAFPNNDIPADAYVKAMAYYDKIKLSKSAFISSSAPWTSIGPMNIGGRTLCVVLNPSDTGEVWLGSASGGLWKSNTGGIGYNAWQFVPTGFPILGVSSIAFNPANTNEMLIGTGETYFTGNNTNGLIDRTTRGIYGMGMFKTTDGGATWTQVLNWTYNQGRCVWDIVFNPLKPSTVYAATTEGVYKSYDTGNSWSLVLNQNMCMDLEIHNTDTNIVLCGVGNLGSTSHGIYRTTNSGSTWTQLGNPLPTNNTGKISLTKYAGNNDVMMAHVCDMYSSTGFYKSTDKGATWSLVTSTNVGSYQGWFCGGLAIKTNDANYVSAGGVYNFVSTNGGGNLLAYSTYWQGLPSDAHPDIHDIKTNPLDPEKLYLATDGGLFRSNDFGVSYYECTSGYVTSQFYIGSVSATDSTVMLGGAQDNFTSKYIGSNYWNPVIGGDGCYNAIDQTNDQVQYGSYQYLNVISSTDQGNSFWNQILTYASSPTGGNSTAFLAPFTIAPSDPTRLYAGEQSLLRSDDQGMSFNAMGNSPVFNNAIILSIGVSHTNADTLYFATAPDGVNPMKLFFSPDGGITQTDVTGTTLPNRYPRRIAVDPNDSKTAYVVFSGFGSGHIFKTTNAGASWTDISTTLPDLPFHCIVVDPLASNYVYAGCDYGAFFSSDGGQTWTTWDSGFPDITMVFDLVISPQGREMLAFSHGRGIFKRPLESINTGISSAGAAASFNLQPNPAVNQINFSLNEETGQLKIYNLEGRLVKQQTVNKGFNTVYLSELGQGMYIAALEAGGSIRTRRFVKTNN